VQGSPLERDDLYRAGVKSATGAVVLGKAAQGSGVHDSHIDAQSIFSFQGITEMNPSISCIVEIINHNNIEFLEMGIEMPSYYGLLVSCLPAVCLPACRPSICVIALHPFVFVSWVD
jgi:hypothetical protein